MAVGILGAAQTTNAYSTSSTSLVAVDTTNLRVTFTAPSSGSVLVRLYGAVSSGGWPPLATYFGVLEGSTNLGFGFATGFDFSAGSMGSNVLVLVSGLAAGSHTFDFGWYVDASNSTGMNGGSILVESV